MIKCVFFLGYTTSWVIDNVQLIKYDRFLATGSDAVQGGCRSACRITCSSPFAIPGGGLANDWRRLWSAPTPPPTHTTFNKLAPHTRGQSEVRCPYRAITRWRPVLYFLDTEFHTFFSGQVPISSDIHVVRTFQDMSGARPGCQSWPDCSLRPFP